MIQQFQLLNFRTEVPVAHVQYLPGFFSEDEIERIDKLSDKFQYKHGDILGNGVDSKTVVRQSKIKWLAWDDENWWIYEKLTDGIKELNNLIWKFDLFGINEYLQYTEYHSLQQSGDHYDWHMDVSHEGLASNRKLSFECILDDRHRGGELSILLGPTEHKIKLKNGDAIVFPSFLANKVYPVESGIRKSLAGWVSGPSFR